MVTYSTGNPIGSADPRDLYDNAQVVDQFANSDDFTAEDRLGRTRLTIAGMNEAVGHALASAGYEFVGDYAAGIELTTYNQVVRDTNGEFWRVSGSTGLPYTTTGAGMPEGGAFVSVGDAALRQDLADPALGGGLVQVTTSTGEQTLAGALDERVNKGEVGDEIVSTSTGEQDIVTALNERSRLDWLISNAETISLLDGIGSSYTIPEIFILDKLIFDLKKAGLYAKLDALYVFAFGGETLSKINIVDPGNYDAQTVGAVNHAPFSGYSQSGGQGHISTGFNISNPGNKYSRNSATLFVYSLSSFSQGSTSADIGLNNTDGHAYLNARSGSTIAYRSNRSGGTNSIVSGNPTAFGLSAWTRESENDVYVYKDGVRIWATTTSSDVLVNDEITVLKNGANYNERLVGAAGYGGALTQEDHRFLYQAVGMCINSLRGLA